MNVILRAGGVILMIRGIYTGASGMLAEAQRTDAISNNLANVNTVGFKKDVTIMKDFANLLISRVNDGADAQAIGNMGVGVMVDEVATDQSTGIVRTTGNDFDLAMEGKGFFVVQAPQGKRYTRNGSFAKSARGELVTSDGYQVLGDNGGPIIIGDGKLTVGTDGRVSVDNKVVGKLQLADFANEATLKKEGASLFIAPDDRQAQPATGGVRQGALEMANVNVVSEMVNLITNLRAYEVNSKVIQSHDELLNKAANDVGKV
jgi:flagellar basal-body rod protein FlgF